MSIRNAGEVIREARLRAGLSQEALSEGICSYVTLCNIEKGTYGVSPLTFELLTSKAGAFNEVYPCFENINDYQCFWNIINIRFYISHHSIEKATDELAKLSEKNFNKNKYYYQEWALYKAKIETIKGNTSHHSICDYLYKALLISKPNIDLYNLSKNVLSVNEIHIICLYTAHNLALGNIEDSMKIHEQLSIYMKQAKFADREGTLIDINLALLKSLALIYTNNYQEALDLLTKYNVISNHYINESNAYDFFYLKAACQYKLDLKESYQEALLHIKNCEENMGAYYKPMVFSFLEKLGIEDFMVENPYSFTMAFVPKPDFRDGTFDIYGKDVMTLGSIIRYHRTEQKISAKTLCDGLCGVSLLSKIENNQISPDIILACTLLSRLGISDNTFTFHGNKTEAEYFDLKDKILYKMDNQKVVEAFQQLEKIYENTNKPIIKQFFLHRKITQNPLSNMIKSYDKYEENCNSLIQMTHKNFDIENIEKYRLSFDEYRILLSLIPGYSHTNNPAAAINAYKKLSQYIKLSNSDLLQSSRYYTYTMVLYFEFLYLYKLYSNIIFEMEYGHCPEFNFSIRNTGMLNFYYSIALAEAKEFERAKKVASYSLAQFTLIGMKKASEELIEIFKSQYSIDLQKQGVSE